MHSNDFPRHSVLLLAVLVVCVFHPGACEGWGQPSALADTGKQLKQAGRSPFGTPISDWYFVIRTSPGWLSRSWPYCGISGTSIGMDSVITCNKTDVPFFSLFALVSPSSQLPAVTGQPLLLMSRTNGLCGTPKARQPTTSTNRTTGSSHSANNAQGGPHSGLKDRTGDVGGAIGGAIPPDSTPVSCRSNFEQGLCTFKLMGADLAPGVPLDLTNTTNASLYLMEGDKFCGVADTLDAKNSLVCNLNTTDGAMKFTVLKAAMPYASLTSVASKSRCGVKSLLLPPPHDLMCIPGGPAKGTGPEGRETSSYRALAVQGGQMAMVSRGRTDVMTNEDRHVMMGRDGGQHAQHGVSRIGAQGRRRWAGWMAGGDDGDLPSHADDGERAQTNGLMWGGVGGAWRWFVDLWMSMARSWPLVSGLGGTVIDGGVKETGDRNYMFTLLLQKPGTVLGSGSIVAMVTYSEGLVGFPLQQCCPLPDSPHIVDCGVAGGDPVPASCWFTLYKVDGKSGEPVVDGDLVMLQSKAFSRWCSITVDGTLLCVSAYPSNATRNLFKYQSKPTTLEPHML